MGASVRTPANTATASLHIFHLRKHEGTFDDSLRLSPVILRCGLYVNTSACGPALQLAGDMRAGQLIEEVDRSRKSSLTCHCAVLHEKALSASWSCGAACRRSSRPGTDVRGHTCALTRFRQSSAGCRGGSTLLRRRLTV